MRTGRPRSPTADAAIFDAAIALIRDAGYDDLTMDGIARRAGVSKATVYRRWSGKEVLVAAALARVVSRIRVPDSGDTARDLHAAMEDTLKLYADPATVALLSGLVAAMARSGAIARAIRSGIVASRRAAFRTILERGVRRGDFARHANVEVALDLLSGPLAYRALITGKRVDRRFASGVVTAVLRAFAPV